MIAVNFFHSKWASARGINSDIALKAKTELDANLRLFYAEARNKDGENCTLLGFRKYGFEQPPVQERNPHCYRPSVPAVQPNVRRQT